MGNKASAASTGAERRPTTKTRRGGNTVRAGGSHATTISSPSPSSSTSLAATFGGPKSYVDMMVVEETKERGRGETTRACVY